MLIFGGGDTADLNLGISPSEPLTNLEDILTEAGYGVDVSSSLPKNLMQYKAIWFVDTNPLSGTEPTEFEAFVNAGRGLFLTGETDECCLALDSSDGTLINALVTGGGVQAGGLGYANSPNAANTVNGSSIDQVATNPNALTAWTPSGPGGIDGVGSTNVLTSTDFGGQPTATGAVWDGTSLNGGVGRLAILMDINWLESEFWDQATATQMVLNLGRFLMSATPVKTATSPQWAGYAATAHGVQDVTGEWTVPTVDCTQAPEASAVGIWVGIDGFGNEQLVKAGVGVTCASPAAPPCYYAFTEVRPGTEHPIPGTGCSGSVSPGDDISVDVTNSPFGSSTFVATITDNGNALVPPITLTAQTKRDKSAECVVQLPPGYVGPTPAAHYTELADFGTVSFTGCSATATQNAGPTLDTDQLATGSDGAFAVTSLNLGRHARSKATTMAPSFPSLTWSVSWISAK